MTGLPVPALLLAACCAPVLKAGEPDRAPSEGRPVRHILGSRADYLGPGREEPDPPGLTEVRIGWFGPPDPPNGLARNLWRGATLAIEEANCAGGYHGLPFRLVARWAKDPWADGSRQVAELVYRDRVWAILGSIDGAATHIAEQLVIRARVPLIAPVCSDAGLTEAGVPWIFRCAPDDLQQSRVLAHMLADAGSQATRAGQAARALAFVSATDHDSRAGVQVLLKEAQAAARIVPQWHLEIDVKQPDYAPQLDRLRDYGADTIVLWAPPEPSARFIRQLRKRGGKQRVCGPAILACNDFLQAAGPAAEGVMTVVPWTQDGGKGVRNILPERPEGCCAQNVPDPFSAPASPNEQFRQSYASRFGEPSDYVAAYAYDAATLLVQAVRRSGLNRVRIREELARLRGYVGVTGPFLWDNGGGNVRTPLPAVVRSGRVHVLADPHSQPGP